MSERRRDNRNRILHNGESQRQDGRYAYKYKDINGETKFVYSWRLDKNDRAPAGKPRDLSLREKERQIQQDLFNQIVPNGGNLTVLELVQKYLSLKVNVRHNTQANYNFVVGILKKEAFGSMRIDKVKLSDAKAWLIKLQKDGRGYSTIHSVRGVVRPAFEMAVQDDLIRKNPFGFELATVVVNDSVTREAITRAQERAFLKFIQEDNCYRKHYDGIYILFHTGLRISEFCGLTISDIDFQNKRIRVDHQLQRKRDMEYIIEDTKTKSGERYVPMSQQVVECFSPGDCQPQAAEAGADHRWLYGLPVSGQERGAYGCPPLGALLQAYPEQVQQHLQSSASKNHTPRMPTHFLLQHGAQRHEPENPAVHHGSLGYQRHAEHLHPPDF